ncbi:SDR family oxidoreductase [Bacillus sp. FJAT-26390]|uniref:SDR family oxidoreductase n=1 Tax=Bacillus sp. FJAT-26390 TaxID=1743142 RepID=UPI000807B7CA|nr:NAD-dependent epimerase/dehydratase family protein [Bacillus sp. FJAT-26390]OBZ11231.1 hypothetical protein A7975_19955 [Bacillus sp. FJAT-26390]
MLYVTGITGHTGRWFLQKLIKENYTGRIRCLVRENSNTESLDSSGLDIEIVYGNLEDTTILEKSMVGVDTLVHISTILFSRNIVEAAIKNNVRWAILIHTTGRFSKYKSASEEYINIEEEILKKRDEIGITVLRPTMIYGSSADRNMYKLVDYIYNHKFFPVFGKGENLMQPVHAKDLGYAYYNVLINENKTYNNEYNLSGKEAIKYLDLLKCVSSKLNKKTIFINIPISVSITAAKILNKIKKNAIISVEQVLRMQEDKTFSYAEANRDFNYSPMSFSEGIDGEVKEYISVADKRK